MTSDSSLFDLHVHSVHSDGLKSLMQLAELTRLSGLGGCAVTDHDILPDPSALQRLSSSFGVELLAGVELSTQCQARGLHLLGYGFDPRSPALVEACRRLQEARRVRWTRMVESLRAKNIRLDEQRMARLAETPSPGRLHLARELVRQRHASTVRSAFQRYLSGPDPSLAFDCLSTADAIRLLHEAGGVAILAHPPSWLTREQWNELFDAGLDGLESRFPAATKRHSRLLQERANERGLLTTAGSDYHGDELRTYLGLHTVDRSVVDRLVRPRADSVTVA